jgi:hypothetical protein
VNKGKIRPTTLLLAAIYSGLRITFIIQDGSTKYNSSKEGTATAATVEDDCC